MIRLEPLARPHAAALFAALDDPAVSAHLPAPDVTTLAALEARIERVARDAPAGERWLNFAILDGDVVIGRVEATVYAATWAEIAYLVGPAHQGRGAATRAVQLLLEHLPGEVWVAIHPANARSIALVTRLGFARAAIPPGRPLGSYAPGDTVYVRYGTSL